MRDCILDGSLMAMVLSAIREVFTSPSLASFLTLAAGWVLCRTRRTTTGLIVVADPARPKHFSSYHRLFSRPHGPPNASGRASSGWPWAGSAPTARSC